ncbi:MAG: hypothetical protein AAGL69_02840 [Pseudomonadota bacterium]
MNGLGGVFRRGRLVLNLLRLLGLTAIAVFLVACAGQEQDSTPLLSWADYRSQLEADIASGGQLFCESDSGGQNQPYDNCEIFHALREQGCYGYTTFDIGREINYESTCVKRERLREGQLHKRHFFALTTNDWWRSLPAEIVPLPGGIYSDNSYDVASKRHRVRVVNRTLDEIDLEVDEATNGRLIAMIGTTHEDCGVIRDVLSVSAMTLVDIDADGIAELVLEGYRVNKSETCQLGSGNSLGARFFAIVRKTAPRGPVELLHD